MGGESNSTKWVGVRPTNPEEAIPVKQADPADLAATVTPAAGSTWTVVQTVATNLKAAVQAIAGSTWTVVQATAANLKAQVEPIAASTWTVVQGTAANLKATVTPAAASTWGVVQATASNLKAQIEPITGATFTVVQSTIANLKATITPVAGAEFNSFQRKPASATEVYAEGSAVNQTTRLYTVTASKTFYMSGVIVTLKNDSAAVEILTLYIRTDGGANVARLVFPRVLDGQNMIVAHTFQPPIELASEYRLDLISPAASTEIKAFVHGYEI